MALPIWAGYYIGIPFVERGRDLESDGGYDCWGLVRAILDFEFGVRVPSYKGRYKHSRSRQQLGKLIPEEATAWQEIKLGDEKPGDVIVLRMLGQPMHVGVVIGDKRMIHVYDGINTVVECYTGMSWRHLITGIYRHKDLTDG